MKANRQSTTSLQTVITRLVFGAVVAASLVTGSIGGLVRAGASPVSNPGPWFAQAVVAHAFLMVCSFLGTVIGIERAVAVKKPWAFVAPAASGLAGLAMLAGHVGAAAWLALLAAGVFVAVNILVVSRQRAAHTVLLLIAASAWCVGCAFYALGTLPDALLPLWFAFLVITIAAERLEMTRLMKRRRHAAALLYAALTTLLLGAATSGLWRWGGVVYGAGLLGLALWLFSFDIARRTISAQALSRYMAICLLLGYGWLALAGIAWAATAIGFAARDAALHALALGFVFSMIFGHAPVILPAVARVKLHFSLVFYLPLLLLHSSLLIRLLLAQQSRDFLRIGAWLNTASIALFAACMAGSALAWRFKHSSTPSHHGHAHRH